MPSNLDSGETVLNGSTTGTGIGLIPLWVACRRSIVFVNSWIKLLWVKPLKLAKTTAASVSGSPITVWISRWLN